MVFRADGTWCTSYKTRRFTAEVSFTSQCSFHHFAPSATEEADPDFTDVNFTKTDTGSKSFDINYKTDLITSGNTAETQTRIYHWYLVLQHKFGP